MDDNMVMDRPRSSSRSRSRSRSSALSRGRSRNTSRSRRRSRSSGFLGISNLPTWVPISLGIVGVCGLVYGLMQLDTVSDFMDPVIHDVGEFFGLTEEEGIDATNITHDRMYSGIGS
jgi:hypothetical protein